MFSCVEDAIVYIESKRNKRTVDELRKTLNRCGISMKQRNMIHIAGTNGKGSTVNYLRSILNKHGYRVGTFTSPYLVEHHDRIRVDNQPISDEDLLFYINKYYHIIEEENMSMFEIDVLIMLAYFQSLDLDYRIIETGIGGLHDKTNVIDPIVGVITNIGFDHQDMLGNSLYEITNEKMGIIKPNQIFITSEIKGMLLARLQEQCDVMGVRMHVVPECQVSQYPYRFSYQDMSFVMENQGIYQVMNARLALTIASHLITLDAQKTKDAVENTVWEGRYEKVRYHGRDIWLDGAHNVPGIKALMQTLSVQYDEKVTILFSTLKDKNVEDMLMLIKKEHHRLYITQFEDERFDDLTDRINEDGIKFFEKYEIALEEALRLDSPIVVTGSLHFISQVRAYIMRESE